MAEQLEEVRRYLMLHSNLNIQQVEDLLQLFRDHDANRDQVSYFVESYLPSLEGLPFDEITANARLYLSN